MKGKVTADRLAEAGACEGEVARFRAEWPNGCRVTLRNCRRAVELDLDLQWAAKYLLPAPAYRSLLEEMAPAWEAYERETAPASEAYREKLEQERELARADFAAYLAQTAATAWEAWEKATAPAWRIYREALAEAFYHAASQTPSNIG